MKKAVIIAPHADDELLSCGGTILKLIERGWEVSWIIGTKVFLEDNCDTVESETRSEQIRKIFKALGMHTMHQLNYPAGRVCSSHVPSMVTDISKLFKKIEPRLVFLPFPGDAHTDHNHIFQAGKAACKWFRHSYVEKVVSYETLSETNFDYNPNTITFRPNCYIDIEEGIEKKIKLTEIYYQEFGIHPFPRSPDAIRALSQYRGSSAGYKYAEAFQILLSRGDF